MRRLAFAIVFFLYATGVRAKNYIDYYRGIAIGEAYVVDGKYEDAVKQYNAVFAQYPYSNPLDCYVATQVAAYIGDTSVAIVLMRRGISFGLPVETINGNPHLQGIFRMLKQATVDSCWGVYQSNINHEARAAIIKLIQYDQSIVLKLPPGGLYERGGHELKKVYQPTWDSLLKELVHITTTAGFPAEKVIGTQNGDDSLFICSPRAVFAYYILVHHCNAWPQLKDLLAVELQKGNITPQMYGAIADNSNGYLDYDRMQYFCVRECDSKACKASLNERLDNVNKDRTAIGLCSYTVMQKKFESTRSYHKWVRKGSGTNKPVFDFQPDMHFMGKSK